MSLLCDLLLYASLPGRGFSLIANPQVDENACALLVDRVVGRLWDPYHPPLAGFRAAFVEHEPHSGVTLFGWVFDEGSDDLGRAHAPCFLALCPRSPIRPGDLAAIFTALAEGPPSVDSTATPLPTVAIPLVAPASRPGVAIDPSLQTFAFEAVAEGKPLSLASTDSPQTNPAPLAPRRSPVAPLLAAALLGAAVSFGLWGFTRFPPPLPVGASQSQSVAALAPTGLLKLPTAVWSLAFSPDGRLLTGCADGTVRLWNADTPAITLRVGRGALRSLTFSPDGSILAISGDSAVHLFDWASRTPIAVLTGHTSTVWTAAFSPDGRSLASASSDGTVRLHRLDDGGPATTLAGEWTFAAQFSPDGRLLATGGQDRAIHLYSADGRPYRTFSAHADAVRALAFSPDGRTLASAGWDGSARLWNVVDQQLLGTLAGHTDRVTSLAFSPDGRLLATGSIDGTVRLWDATSKQQLAVARLSEWVLAVHFSPDGRTLVAGGRDGTLARWRVSGP